MTASPGYRFLRSLARLPLMLYSRGHGGLLGPRFLRLRHRGRRSGQLHDTVLEVVRADPSMGIYVVSSGFGAKAQWYQNLAAYPYVEVEVGKEVFGARAVLLTPTEGRWEESDYVSRHPWAAALLSRLLPFEDVRFVRLERMPV